MSEATHAEDLSSPLKRIISMLQAPPHITQCTSFAPQLFEVTSSIEQHNPGLEQFTEFLYDAHNLMITGETSKRSTILRAMRLCITAPEYVDVLVAEEIHFIVVTSLERDSDYLIERMQALKLVERIRIVSPMSFCPAFGRSLVAIVTHREEKDSFRRICCEALRELALVNPKLVAAVNGFAPLMDAVVDPINQTLADAILATILYLLNDHTTRKHLIASVDLRSLLAPFLDLDSTPSELAVKWRAAKSAMVLIMRSWVGLVMMSTEDTGLPTLVRMLRDPKVPIATQEIILETLVAIFEPVYSKVKATSRMQRHQQHAVRGDEDSSLQLNNSLLTDAGSRSFSLYSINSPEKRKSSFVAAPVADDAATDETRIRAPLQVFDSQTDENLNETNGKATASRRPSSWGKRTSDSLVSNGPEKVLGTEGRGGSPSQATARISFALPFFFQWQQPQDASTSNSNNTEKHTIGDNLSIGVASNRRNGNAKGNNVAATDKLGATFGAGHENLPQPQRSASTIQRFMRRSFASTSPQLEPSSAGTLKDAPASQNNKIVRRHSFQHLWQLRGHDSFSGSFDGKTTMSNGELRRSGFLADQLLETQQQQLDPIFNLMENYAALLCCAFLNADLITSLFQLGIVGQKSLAKKSRELMVNFLRIVANIFPESMCSELLALPSLIRLSSNISSFASLHTAHKASQILISLAEAFSLMPYKQTGGTHVSGLSLAINRRPSNKVTVPIGSAAMGITGALSTAVSSSAGNSSILNSSIGGGGIGYNSTGSRSNFPPLNVQTIFELAEEIKISSFSRISGISPSSIDGTRDVIATAIGANTATVDLLSNLRTALTTDVDKNDFNQQMEASRVIGREGKEPFKWDWLTISDMLEYSFKKSERLNEALKTKWIKRISGFYRCSVDEKGYFANLEWEPNNLQYFECACHLYSVLLKVDAGVAFLTSDRRGMLFNEMAHELEQLLFAAEAMNGLGSSNHSHGYNGSYGNSNGSTALAATTSTTPGLIAPPFLRNVFRIGSCTNSMSREFFALLGRIIHTTGSKHLMECTDIFPQLSHLIEYPSLQYLCRLVMTALSFTDGGVLSRHLIHLWTGHPQCTSLMRLYLHSLLRVLLRSGVAAGIEAFAWCVDAIANQVCSDEQRTDEIMKALLEVSRSKANLRAIISKRPRIDDDEHPIAQLVLGRFLCVPEGIAFLQEPRLDDAHFRTAKASAELDIDSDDDDPAADPTSNEATAQPEYKHGLHISSWLAQELDRWERSKCTAYGSQVEQLMTHAFSNFANNRGSSGIGGAASRPSLQPIPIQSLEFLHEMHARNTAAPSSNSISASLSNTDGSFDENISKSDPNGGLSIDLHGLMRIPWNVEVKLTAANQSATSSPGGEYLRIDSYFDPSEMPSALAFETVSDSTRLVRVRSMVLDNRGLRAGYPVETSKNISATFLVGVCAVSRNGRILGCGEARSTRRKSTLGSVGERSVNGRSGAVVTPSGSPSSGGNAVDTGVGITDRDIPVTMQLEANYDWFTCKSSHRQQNYITELPDGRFSVSVPGDPVVWIFSRQAMSSDTSHHSSTTKGLNDGNFRRASSQPLAKHHGGGIEEKQYFAGGTATPTITSTYRTEVTESSIDGNKQSLSWATTASQSGGNPHGNTYVRRASDGAGAFNSAMQRQANATDRSRSKNNVVYLEEVHFYMRLETGYAIFAPMPMHVYGELSRTMEGCDILYRRNTITELLRKARRLLSMANDDMAYDPSIRSLNANPYSVRKNNRIGIKNSNNLSRVRHRREADMMELQGAIWALSHIASNEAGFALLQKIERRFVDWCVDNISSCRNYSLRGVFFYALGLISRTLQGSQRLAQLGWGSAPPNTNAAVAFPLDPQAFFRRCIENHKQSTLATSATQELLSFARESRGTSSSNNDAKDSAHLLSLSEELQTKLQPFSPVGMLSTEEEILNLIAKLPGVIVFRECRARLEFLRRKESNIFKRRELYLRVHSLMESCTFKLLVRREVLALFDDEAKLKNQGPRNSGVVEHQ